MSLEQIEEKLDRLIKGLSMVLSEVKVPEFRGPTVNFYQPSTGQLQFSVSAPRYREPEKTGFNDAGVAWASKMGAVFIEAAPPLKDSDPPRLDWVNKKMVFALADKDLGECIWSLKKGEPVVITHTLDEKDSKNNNKMFKIEKGNEYRGKPQWKISLSEVKNGERNFVSVFVGGPDIMRLTMLLEAALPYIMGCHKT